MSNEAIATLIEIIIIIIIVIVNGLVMYFQSKKNEEEEEKEISATNNNTDESEEDYRYNSYYNCKVINIENKTSEEIERELKSFLNKKDIDIYGNGGKIMCNDKNIIIIWNKEEE